MQETRQTRTNRPYELCEYTEEWSLRFHELRDFLENIFGSNAVSIEHVGSTSIPGMLAKPIIDVVVVVSDLESVKHHYEYFETNGFECKGDFTGQNEEYFTNTTPEGIRKSNVHVMQENNPHITEALNFRDYMRAELQPMSEYRDIKVKLKETYGTEDYNSYDSQKSILMESLKASAKDWASSR